MVLRRFLEVLRGFGMVFLRVEKDFAGFSAILRGFEGPGGVRESSRRSPGTFSERLGGFEEV